MAWFHWACMYYICLFLSFCFLVDFKRTFSFVFHERERGNKLSVENIERERDGGAGVVILEIEKWKDKSKSQNDMPHIYRERGSSASYFLLNFIIIYIYVFLLAGCYNTLSLHGEKQKIKLSNI
jgi:hypothetical protein